VPYLVEPPSNAGQTWMRVDLNFAVPSWGGGHRQFLPAWWLCCSSLMTRLKIAAPCSILMRV
jgi:hypothetical protein